MDFIYILIWYRSSIFRKRHLASYTCFWSKPSPEGAWTDRCTFSVFLSSSWWPSFPGNTVHVCEPALSCQRTPARQRSADRLPVAAAHGLSSAQPVVLAQVRSTSGCVLSHRQNRFHCVPFQSHVTGTSSFSPWPSHGLWVRYPKPRGYLLTRNFQLWLLGTL